MLFLLKLMIRGNSLATIENMSGMFKRCSNLQYLDLSMLNTSNLVNLVNMLNPT